MGELVMGMKKMKPCVGCSRPKVALRSANIEASDFCHSCSARRFYKAKGPRPLKCSDEELVAYIKSSMDQGFNSRETYRRCARHFDNTIRAVKVRALALGLIKKREKGAQWSVEAVLTGSARKQAMELFRGRSD